MKKDAGKSVAQRPAGRSFVRRRPASRVLRKLRPETVGCCWGVLLQIRLRSNRQPAAAPGRRAAPSRRKPTARLRDCLGGFDTTIFGGSQLIMNLRFRKELQRDADSRRRRLAISCPGGHRACLPQAASFRHQPFKARLYAPFSTSAQLAQARLCLQLIEKVQIRESVQSLGRYLRTAFGCRSAGSASEGEGRGYSGAAGQRVSG